MTTPVIENYMSVPLEPCSGNSRDLANLPNIKNRCMKMIIPTERVLWYLLRRCFVLLFSPRLAAVVLPQLTWHWLRKPTIHEHQVIHFIVLSGAPLFGVCFWEVVRLTVRLNHQEAMACRSSIMVQWYSRLVWLLDSPLKVVSQPKLNRLRSSSTKGVAGACPN